jgi:Xaa-Pro dipeptidase
MGSPVVRWEKESPLTVDVGFGLEGYVTDKTQVYWSGPPSTVPDEFRAAHDFCVELQHRMAERLLPGSVPADIAADAFDLAGRRGWSEGFMALGANKVPFVGHGIGLAVDEYPVLAKGFDAPLDEGMVIALEPKVGISGIGMAGVENTFEVTGRGGRCLTGEDFSILPVPAG